MRVCVCVCVMLMSIWGVFGADLLVVFVVLCVY